MISFKRIPRGFSYQVDNSSFMWKYCAKLALEYIILRCVFYWAEIVIVTMVQMVVGDQTRNQVNVAGNNVDLNIDWVRYGWLYSNSYVT